MSNPYITVQLSSMQYEKAGVLLSHVRLSLRATALSLGATAQRAAEPSAVPAKLGCYLASAVISLVSSKLRSCSPGLGRVSTL